jgi:alcohol dehydrogenase
MDEAAGESANDDLRGLSVGFDFRPTTRVVYGVGTLERVGEHAVEAGIRRALLVTDRGIRAAGHADAAARALAAAGATVEIFDGVEENPTTRHVDACHDAAKRFAADGFVAVGGGSSMDCAKGANFLLTNGGRMADYWGVGKATKPMLPAVAVPTTAGTGSEAQSFALVADERTHRKMACGDKKAMFKVAVLDPAVTVSQPPPVTAVVGVDAIAHAVESYVCTKRSALSIAYAAQAFELLDEWFPQVLSAPTDLRARGGMLLGAHFAGAAIEASMLGAAHAAANPLTAHFDVTHGIAVGVMLPWVVRFNADVCERRYAHLAPNAGSGENLAARIERLLRLARLPTRLRDLAVPDSSIGTLAEDAAKQWTAGFNPRPVGPTEFAQLYRQAW